MVAMKHLDEMNRILLLTAREREYERLAARYAGLLSRCGRLGALMDNRLASCRAQQQRLTDGAPPR